MTTNDEFLAMTLEQRRAHLNAEHERRKALANAMRDEWHIKYPMNDYHSFVRNSVHGLFDEIAYASDSTVDEYSNEIDAVMDLSLARAWTIDMYDDDEYPNDAQRRDDITEFLRYASIHAMLRQRDLEILNVCADYRDDAERESADVSVPKLLARIENLIHTHTI